MLLYFRLNRKKLSLSAVRLIPIIVALILAGTLVYTAMVMVPQATGGLNVSLRVGYPDSLDESDVTDMYAYTQILAPEGIHVTPTFYDAPPLSYKGLISNQEDISFDTSAQTMALGPAQGQNTTCITSYALAGVFLSIAGQGITSPQNMTGKWVDDFGPGSSTRALDLYWYGQAGIKVSQDPTTANPNTVNFRNIGGNIARVSDLEKKNAAAIVVDDFILSDFTGSANTTANGGPFHVLFYAPNNFYDNCFAVRDSWLQSTTNGVNNTKIAVMFVQAIIQAQRYFISNPSALVTFAETQLPLTAPSEIQFTSTFYPAHYTYWPFGAYNLVGPANVTGKFAQTNTYFLTVGDLTSPVSNSSVKPYGVVNAWFEYQALKNLGPYTYPVSSSWLTPAIKSYIQQVVPSQWGTVG
jgi:ABC-type nitrate/sulfonate/bicarbonate transport system substrate-binding protein